jgi:hypothetical protein
MSQRSISLEPPSPEAVAFRPEFFRLPRPGPREVDPFFGLTRAYYYLLEKRGLLKMYRLLHKGNDKGVTLIRYKDVWDLIHSRIQDQEGSAP